MPSHDEHGSPATPLGDAESLALSESMRPFSAASRVRLLFALLERERTVEDLAQVTGITESSASHQLRVLRRTHLVVARREGRHVRYCLHDHHVSELLAAIRHHAEHVSMRLDGERMPVAVPDESFT